MLIWLYKLGKLWDTKRAVELDEDEMNLYTSVYFKFIMFYFENSLVRIFTFKGALRSDFTPIFYLLILIYRMKK